MITEAEKYRSTANLNVRAAPSATAKTLGKLAIDDVIESEKYYPRTELLGYRIPR